MVRLYRDSDDELELAVPLYIEDIKKVIPNDNPICDLCGHASEYMTFYPELGNRLICESCSKIHEKTVKWHQVDMHTVFNFLIHFVIENNFEWTDLDLDLIDKYFEEHSNRHIKIRDYIKED